MKFIAILSLVLLGTILCDNYAVLVAGSNTYSNYRHQSDVFHHYHILVDRGIKPDHIITFAYDDIANSSRNPFKGQVFNRPDGEDVYAGVKIDYYGEDVTPSNFIAAITGDTEGVVITDERSTLKVLTSTKEDNVFIYFTDHGAEGLICFPSKYLYADELNSALQLMYEKGLYKELVFYLEACESGSMFYDLLPKNISVYATTAANPTESSYAYYCSSEAKVNGTLIGSCLGDEYSIRFMEDIDSRPGDKLKDYTMQEQYEYLVKIVEGSHVQQYGDVEIAKKSIYEFVNAQAKKLTGVIIRIIDIFLPNTRILEEEEHIKINNHNYRLEWYRMEAERSNDLAIEDEYYQEVTEEARLMKLFSIFNKHFDLPKRNYKEKIDFDCYRKVVKSYAKTCGAFIDRDFKYMTNFANFCSQDISPKKAKEFFKTIC